MNMDPNQAWSFTSLPHNDNVNPYCFCVDVEEFFFMRKGKMVACMGQLSFEALGANFIDFLLQSRFNSPAALDEFAFVRGSGKLLLGDNGNHIHSFDLEDGNLTVKRDHVLGFTRGLSIQDSVVEGYLTLLGTGTFIASSSGHVHFLEPPIKVDPEALLGWADMPCPHFSFDYSYAKSVLAMVGASAGILKSGEEQQIEFTHKGGTVLIQSNEEGLMGRNTLDGIIAAMSGMHRNEVEEIRRAAMAILNPK